mmetsp:Transcript_22096/g.86880  ORF Transcript_22096/g.86880 Transcript_22096/m.86880 type:complete len:600 (+) Transcript_22096:52-1851(+)
MGGRHSKSKAPVTAVNISKPGVFVQHLGVGHNGPPATGNANLVKYESRINAVSITGGKSGVTQLNKLCSAMEKVASMKNPNVRSVVDRAGGSVWGSGVGYGNGSSNYDSIQAKKDFKSFELARERIISQGVALMQKAARKPTLVMPLKEAVQESKLHMYIASRLDNDSMMDIAKHGAFYLAVWQYLACLLQTSDLSSVVLRDRDMKALMCSWVGLAENYRKTMASIGRQDKEGAQHEELVEVVLEQKDALIRSRASGRKRTRSSRTGDRRSTRLKGSSKRRTRSRATKEEPCEAATPTDADGDVVMDDVAEAGMSSGSEAAREPAAKQRKMTSSPRKSKAKKRSAKKAKKEKAEPPCDPAAKDYIDRMVPLTFGSYSGSSSNTCACLGRAMTELQSLAGALPSLVHPDTSVFIRTNENNIQQMQAMIIGPKGTPYQNGCFLFNLGLPNNYPSSPPTCVITNTGGGRFRFNPNLYANGKVCLSLLGTWAGTPEEMWNEDSTIYQVLVSIQSLILVENPYYNEPSYQFKPNVAASDHYNANVRSGCVQHAMIDVLKEKNGPFYDAVSAHFALKKAEILEQVADWKIGDSVVAELTVLLNEL